MTICFIYCGTSISLTPPLIMMNFHFIDKNNIISYNADLLIYSRFFNYFFGVIHYLVTINLLSIVFTFIDFRNAIYSIKWISVDSYQGYPFTGPKMFCYFYYEKCQKYFYFYITYIIFIFCPVICLLQQFLFL